MILLSCNDLSRGFDAGPLFENIGFEVHSSERIGLVGPNGVGKTTLLRLLTGLDRPDVGTVRLHAGARVALLRQQPEWTAGRKLFEEARSALDDLLSAHTDMVAAAEKLATTTDEAERKALAQRYERLHELLHYHDAYNVDHRVEQVLEGLGFSSEDYEKEVDILSGGQRSRLMLAKLLLSAPDVMLLDEPNNHLDIDATRWLEEYLVKQHEAMLIVSHDRYFLDRVTTKIFELSQLRINMYPGNFQAYWKLRKERQEQQQKAWDAQREYIAKQEEYIRRVHYGQLHKQAQSRAKALERLELVERPVQYDSPHMHFGPARRTGDVVFEVTDLAKSFDRPLFEHLSFSLPRGKRLGILGPNGSGKTTLLRILLGEERPDRGTVQRGHLVEFGYYDQHLRMLDDDKTVIQAVWPKPDPEVTEQRMRDLLGRFGLTGDQVYQRVGELSGGERSRAALARLVVLGVNVLVLDEPTNHLDLWACDALEQALLEFDGTVIVVSHDRFFLNRIAELLIVLDRLRPTVVYGNYDTYERMRSLRAETEHEALVRRVHEKDRGVTTPAEPATARKPKRRFPYRKAADIETEIAGKEELLRSIEEKLASAELYRDGDKVKETMRTFEETKSQLQHLYEHWEEALELNG